MSECLIFCRFHHHHHPFADVVAVVVVVDDAAAVVVVAVAGVVVDAVAVSQHLRGNSRTNSCYQEMLRLCIVFDTLHSGDALRKLYTAFVDLVILLYSECIFQLILTSPLMLMMMMMMTGANTSCTSSRRL